MTTVMTTKYITKEFGEYNFQVDEITGYFNASNILDTYNEHFKRQKIKKRMIEYMKRPCFFRLILSYFDSIADKKLIDYNYLNNLCKSEEDIINLSSDIKYKYMVREISKINGSCKKILFLYVHPMVAVGIAMWLNKDFGHNFLTYVKKLCATKDLIFTDETNTTLRLSIPKPPKDNLEENIRDRICKEQNGRREVSLKNSGHRIDILSKEYIIEIKCYSNRIKAIGQVKYYQVGYPSRKLWIHIFNHNDSKDGYFEEACERDNIKLTYE